MILFDFLTSIAYNFNRYILFVRRSKPWESLDGKTVKGNRYEYIFTKERKH